MINLTKPKICKSISVILLSSVKSILKIKYKFSVPCSFLVVGFDFVVSEVVVAEVDFVIGSEISIIFDFHDRHQYGF